MPNWKRLVGRGLRPREPRERRIPLISPILWTTRGDRASAGPATGSSTSRKSTRRRGAKVPISGDSRRVPAVWNIASAAGRKVGVVGLVGDASGRGGSTGSSCSDRVEPHPLRRACPLAGVAFPASLEPGVAQIVARDGHVTRGRISRRISTRREGEIAAALESGAGMENPIVALARILAATRVTQRDRAAISTIASVPDLDGGLLRGHGRSRPRFRPVHAAAARLPGRSADADVAKYCPRRRGRTYAVGRPDPRPVVASAPSRTAPSCWSTRITASSGGSDRPCGLASGSWATAAFWHRPEGVLVLWGAGVRTGQPQRRRSRLVDVAPTVLALLEVPGDRRMTGEPVAAAFAKPLRFSKADRAGLAVARVAAGAASDAESSEYAKKLLALGYLSPGETTAVAPPGGTLPGLTEGAWNNLGTYELQTKKNLPAAKAAFEAAHKAESRVRRVRCSTSRLLYRGKERFLRAAEDWLFRSLACLARDGPVGRDRQLGAGVRAPYGGRRPPRRRWLARAVEDRVPEERGDRARERALLLYHAHWDARGAAEVLGPFEAASGERRRR